MTKLTHNTPDEGAAKCQGINICATFMT